VHGRCGRVRFLSRSDRTEGSGSLCGYRRHLRRVLWGGLAGAAISLGATAQTITDGDTLKLNGATYRLWGIDAPEMKQDCPDGWPAGRLATSKLLALIQGKTVVCEAKDKDRYGRTVAICRASGEDLGAIMVREGMAWAFVRYSRDYLDQEAGAKADRLGVHAHDCVPAWEWRTKQRN
jgi:endonuclease YncB( thermonuclease family)